ncbi:hypothetical protein ACQ7CX_11685 [Chryseobacterium arthrosphaerae]|uniref:hypothetical protein n=1 Tax=Chryseobacterium arthrosphaerae TaxID=651561 RepID=UPI001BAE6938|nr:hypothetical protein [Chryseobacterium arthrosphaerae]QUY54098.1 hypothetical protein I2F65_14520 [Chryseobacterium arthrosphaerae]
MTPYNKHAVQKNETLKTVAALYGLEPDALKLFHNNLCSVKDMILIELTGQKEIFIPRNAVEDQNKLVKFGHGNKLAFNPGKMSSGYGVIISIEKGGHKNELKYKTSVRWLKSENNLHYFEIDRTSKLYLNEEEVNEIADMLAYRTSQVLYPLQISVDQKGKFNAVENIDIFKKRWTAVKEEVYKEFDGETVDRYCRKIEEVIEAPETISFYLKSDYFIRTLFWGIYQTFGPDFQITETESFPVVENPVEPQYEIKLEIDPLKDEHGLIRIDGTGTLNDERSSYDFISGAPFSMMISDDSVINREGEFRMRYYLNGQTAFPESVYLECSIKLEEEKKISVVVAAL